MQAQIQANNGFHVSPNSHQPSSIRKRDGVTLQPFDSQKLRNAIHAAWIDSVGATDEKADKAINEVVNTVVRSLPGDVVDVELIQNAVEIALMRLHQYKVAKAYILYRHHRQELRQLHEKVIDPQGLSDYIHASKYARYVPELLRREVYEETVARVEGMHLGRFPNMADEIRGAFKFVYDKQVLPSMRSLDDATLLPTPDGWKPAGEVCVGDRLFGSNGQPCSVLGLEKFNDIELFDVYFSDGSIIRASADHLWVASTLDDRLAGGSKTRVVTTRRISETLRQHSGNHKYPWKYNYAVWNPAGLQLDSINLKLDPYILGLWLGDGYAISGQFSCHQNDIEIANAYEKFGFSEMDLRSNKHVPSEYLRASFDQRLALVQGLMDSDGTTSPDGRSQFSNTNPRILEGMCELLSTLGIKYSMYPVVKAAEHHKEGWTISFFTSLPVHRLSRKAANVRSDNCARNRYRTVVAVEPSGRGDATCFRVDSSDHTYLAGPRMIVTHNSMQFAGGAILANMNRLYNCTASLVDRWEAFSEALFLLLSGSGVGYSVQFDHVEKLAPVGYIDPKRVEHHVVKDTIEGWADALKALVTSFQKGTNLELSYHKVRPAGSPLKTSGGRAPGHLKLKESLERIRSILLSAQGRKLRPIEAHRIMCFAADAVLSGGIRRSAMISLFSLDDSEMMFAKTGNWWQTDPWFANANNSAVLKRDEVKKKQFKRIFQMTREWGEPGFFFVADPDHVTNPCAEISLFPVLTITEALRDLLAIRGVDVEVGSRHTGWALCNLCEINAAKLTSYEDFAAAAKAATVIGTIQATYTTMPYLGWVSEEIAKRDALLGIGMTGIMDAPQIALDPSYQRKIAEQVKEWNREFANRLGINSAARTTCVKPSGTTSLALNCVGSGIHPHHARRYIRRVMADDLEPVFQAFRAANPHACQRKPDGKWVIEFPVQAPDGAILKGDQTAIEFLDTVRSTQTNWVVPGTDTDHPGYNGSHHNVSNTVTVQPDEWDAVANYIWTHREAFTGISLLPSTGDKTFAFAPLEAVTTEADERRWLELVSCYVPVDYTSILEAEDGTALTGEMACAGGMCEVKL